MLWLALHLPDLPLDLWLQRGPDACLPAVAPFAVTTGGQVCRANAAARARGVVPGLGRAAATGLCPGLLLREHQPAREQRLLKALAQSLLRYTPQVSLDDSDAAAPTLLLEIAGCLRLFHGLPTLLAGIDAHLATQGVTVRSGLACTPLAALLLARNGSDCRAHFRADGSADHAALRAVLAALPIHGLTLDPRTEESLMNMGFSRYGELDALPRHTLARRFGQPFAHWLDRVVGLAPDPRQAIRAETFYVREMNFLDGIVHHEGLAFPMQRLLDDFAGFLRQRQLVTQQLVWRCTQVDRQVREFSVRSSRPEIDPERLYALSRLQLENLQLGAPVETLRLACRQFLPLASAGIASSLFPGRDGNEAESHALLDRLRARLGGEPCRRYTVQDSWRPEQAQSCAEDADDTDLPGGPRARRPLWLLPAPARVHHQERQLYWHGRLELLEGPERIEGDWWTQPLQRDYFIARHSEQQGASAGVLYWVFHDRGQDTWFVHGVFG